MPRPRPYPYSIDIRPARTVPGHFTFAINQRRVPRRRSRLAYATFDEARVAAQATVKRLVFEDWLVGD